MKKASTQNETYHRIGAQTSLNIPVW